jgi:hypothetical protein
MVPAFFLPGSWMCSKYLAVPHPGWCDQSAATMAMSHACGSALGSHCDHHVSSHVAVLDDRVRSRVHANSTFHRSHAEFIETRKTSRQHPALFLPTSSTQNATTFRSTQRDHPNLRLRRETTRAHRSPQPPRVTPASGHAVVHGRDRRCLMDHQTAETRGECGLAVRGLHRSGSPEGSERVEGRGAWLVDEGRGAWLVDEGRRARTAAQSARRRPPEPEVPPRQSPCTRVVLLCHARGTGL